MLVITSNPKRINEVLDEIQKFIISKISLKRINQILLPCHEVLINAIKHGNRFNENKNVKIDFFVESNFIVITIKDEGNGYDYVNHKYNFDNLLKTSGRGVFIVQQYTDKIKTEGSKVLLYFKIED